MFIETLKLWLVIFLYVLQFCLEQIYKALANKTFLLFWTRLKKWIFYLLKNNLKFWVAHRLCVLIAETNEQSLRCGNWKLDGIDPVFVQ